MATEILLTKSMNGSLSPVDQDGIDLISRLKIGQGINVKINRVRNIKFHRKAFALFLLAFQYWEPEPVEFRGVAATKNFDRFRKDILILAGHCDVVINIRGEARAEAKSISFASLDEDSFHQVYKSVLDVVWSRIMKNIKGYESADDVERVVQDLLRFDQ